MFTKKNLMSLMAVVMGLAASPLVMAEQYLGAEIREVPFTVAGGEIVKLPFTRNGAVPAQKDGVTVFGAGLVTNTPRDKPGYLEIGWAYTIEVPADRHFVEIVIEDVGGNQPVLMIRQAEPKVETKRMTATVPLSYITLNLEQVAVTRQNTAWLFAEGDSLYVFKFTLLDAAGKTTVLYQPSYFPSVTKKKLLERAKIPLKSAEK